MKEFKIFYALVLVFFCSLTVASAHFGMVIPSDNMVMQDDDRQVDVVLSFSHPFERIGMPLVKPDRFFIAAAGKTKDLTDRLETIKVMDQMAWKTSVTMKRPGAHVFVMVPQPYWEPAEDCFIIHYTKTIIAAFGDDDGWDSELGLKTEIIPLSRPFGLYAGNVFQGIVKLNGQPVPYAGVEVEFFNRDKKVDALTDYMVTQTVKADGNGVFTYAAPAAGWWGFAALNISDKKRTHLGQEKDIELGAVLWVKFEKWQED